jgi:hypothetical protein
MTPIFNYCTRCNKASSEVTTNPPGQYFQRYDFSSLTCGEKDAAAGESHLGLTDHRDVVELGLTAHLLQLPQQGVLQFIHQHFKPNTISSVRDRSYFKPVLWIWICNRIESGFNGVPGSLSGSGFTVRMRIRIQEGKNYPQTLKKINKFHFFEVLDVLF